MFFLLLVCNYAMFVIPLKSDIWTDMRHWYLVNLVVYSFSGGVIEYNVLYSISFNSQSNILYMDYYIDFNEKIHEKY